MDGACTRIGLRPWRRRDSAIVYAWLTRDGGNLWEWNGVPHLWGHTDSYPRIDLRAAGVFGEAEPVTFEELVSGELPNPVCLRLQALLDEVEVCLRPKHDDFDPLAEQIDMMLVFPQGAPAWLTHTDSLRMKGGWDAFLGTKSAQYALARALCDYENARLSASRHRFRAETSLKDAERVESSLPAMLERATNLYDSLRC